MKKLFYLFVTAAFLVSCNPNAKDSALQTNSNNKESDSCTVRISCKDKILLDKAHQIIVSGETYSKRLFDSLMKDSIQLVDTNLPLAQKEMLLKKAFYGMQLRFAERYVAGFDNSLARGQMHQNNDDELDNEYIAEVEFSTGAFSTLCALQLSGEIEGVRAYISKYVFNPIDIDTRLTNTKRYSIILVGTKFIGGSTKGTDVLIPSTPGGSYLISVQNYSEPCRPRPCPETKLIH